jgi:hypothetical protein
LRVQRRGGDQCREDAKVTTVHESSWSRLDWLFVVKESAGRERRASTPGHLTALNADLAEMADSANLRFSIRRIRTIRSIRIDIF